MAGNEKTFGAAGGNKPGDKAISEKGLNLQHEIFVSEYLKRAGNGGAAALAAGYAPKNAVRIAQKLLKRPEIKAALDVARKKIEEEGIYGLKKAMAETEEAMEFARATKNANALASVLQLRAKMNGLVVEKMDHRMSGNLVMHFEGIDNSRAVGPALEQGVVASALLPQGSEDLE